MIEEVSYLHSHVGLTRPWRTYYEVQARVHRTHDGGGLGGRKPHTIELGLLVGECRSQLLW